MLFCLEGATLVNQLERVRKNKGHPVSRRRWLGIVASTTTACLLPRSVPMETPIAIDSPWPGIAVYRRGQVSIYGRSSLDLAVQSLIRSRQIRVANGGDGLWSLNIPRSSQSPSSDANGSTNAVAASTNVVITPFLAGMNYPAWTKDVLQSHQSDQSLSDLRAAGANAVTLVLPVYQDTFRSVTVTRDPSTTPSDSSIRHAVTQAHALDMHVILKPLLILRDTGVSTPNGPSWRGVVTPSSWSRWFDSYGQMLEHYASLGSALGTFGLVIGTEMKSATPHSDSWRGLIARCQKLYSGSLFYCANWDEYDQVKFWDALPMLGIDAYPPLTQHSDPSEKELYQGWQNWLPQIWKWQSSWQKPLMIGEVGYQSAAFSTVEPWVQSQQAPADLELQRRAYSAAISAFRTWPQLAGLFWWNWETDPTAGGDSDNGFTPQNKPAMDVLRAWFKDEGTGP